MEIRHLMKWQYILIFSRYIGGVWNFPLPVPFILPSADGSHQLKSLTVWFGWGQSNNFVNTSIEWEQLRECADLWLTLNEPIFQTASNALRFETARPIWETWLLLVLIEPSEPGHPRTCVLSCTRHCRRIFKNPERAEIAPSVTERVLTTCPPERLFIATLFASGQNITHIQPTLNRRREGVYFRASRRLHYLFSIENTHKKEKRMILPKAPVTPLWRSMLHNCAPLAGRKSQCSAVTCF